MSANLIPIPIFLYPALTDALGSQESLNQVLFQPSKMISISKFGYNPNSGTSYEDIRSSGGVKTYVETAGVASIVSDNSEDEAGGSGAYSAKVWGLKEESPGVYLLATQTIDLTGLTPVVLDGLWFRISKVQILTAGSNGSNGSNEGIITVDIDSNLELIVSVDGNNSSLTTCMTVPSNYIGLIQDRSFTTRDSGRYFDLRIQTRSPGKLFQTKEFFHVSEDVDRVSPIVVPAGADIRCQSRLNTGNRQISGEYLLTLLPIIPIS